MNVANKQTGTVDCALYAMAIITCFALDIVPSNCGVLTRRNAVTPSQVLGNWDNCSFSCKEDPKTSAMNKQK